ncbi:hypothetical protein F4604DRAFT_1720343 [Suillus subluteus]|nr:hypothetical protein F4604DRAFT_1720343 [Suillus subluteus]
MSSFLVCLVLTLSLQKTRSLDSLAHQTCKSIPRPLHSQVFIADSTFTTPWIFQPDGDSDAHVHVPLLTRNMKSFGTSGMNERGRGLRLSGRRWYHSPCSRHHGFAWEGFRKSRL